MSCQPKEQKMKTYTNHIKIKLSLFSIILAAVIFIIAVSPNLVAETKAYDLKAFLNRVETYNKDLKLARKDLDMAKVYKKEALSTALPKIAFESTYHRNLKKNYLYIDFPDTETGETTSQKFKINYKNEYGAQAVINQTLFSFKVSNALKAAKQYKKVTDFAYDATEQTISKYARKAFYQTLLLNKVWEVSRASEKNAKENYLQIKEQYEFGQVSQFQLLQAEVRWQNMIPEVTQTKRNYELALNSLKNMAGIPDTEEITLKGDFDKLPPMPKKQPLETVLEKRPDYNALLWEEQLRDTGIKSEKANRLPSLNLNLIYNFSSQSDRFKLEMQNHSYIVGLNLSFPIYSGGYTAAQIQKAKIDRDKTRIKIEKQQDEIANEIRNIYLRLEEANERMKAAKVTLETARKAFEIAEVSATNGLATQLELKEARVAYDQAQLNGYAAAYDYLDAYFDWELASGNGN